MNKILSIPVHSFSLEPLEDDDRIVKLSMKFMHDGENLNKSDIPLDAIKEAVESTLNNTPTGIPILAAFEDDGSDFKEHNDDEISIGCMPPINNDINYKLDEENNKTYVYGNGYIWRYYSKNAVDILESAKDMSKACSIEIEVLEGHKDRKRGVYIIEKFRFLGITLLGDKYEPGMENAKVTLEYSLSRNNNYINKVKEFSEELNLYFNKKEGENVSEDASYKIDIDNSKDSADMSDKWEIDKGEYFRKIKDSTNAKTVFKEAYADVTIPEKLDDITEADCKYPHHKFNDNKMVVAKAGIQAARQRGKQQGLSDDSKEMKHIKKHYDELGLVWDEEKEEKEKMSKKKIAEKFNLTYDQVSSEIDKGLCMCKFEGTDWWGNTALMQRYYQISLDSDFVYCYDAQEDMYVKIPYTMSNDDVSLDFEKASRIKFTPTDWESASSEEIEDDTMETQNFIKTVKENFNKSYEDLENKVKELDTFSKDLTKENETLKQTFAEINKIVGVEDLKTEVERLKNFELEAEKLKTQDKANALFEKYKEYISDEEKTELNNKLFDFAKFEDFEAQINKIVLPKYEAKVFALSQQHKENPNGIQVSLMGLQSMDNNTKNSSKSEIEQLEEYVNENN